MQKHYNYLDIDLDSKNYRKLRAMQGDTKSRYILVNLYSNNLAYDLSHCTVKIYGLKRDKTIFFNNAVVKNAKLGQFEIELTNQALAVPGELKVQILVLGTDGEKLTSSAFFIDVGESIIDENAIESTNEFGALTESLTKVNEWNGYFEETSGKIEEKYTERLNNVDSQLEHIAILPIKLTGETDDTLSIQRALDIAKSKGGGNVRIPYRFEKYVISSTLKISSCTTLTIDEGAIIKMADESNCRMIENINLSTVNDLTIKDKNITIIGGIWDGNEANQSEKWMGNDQVNGDGLVMPFLFSGVENLTLKDITVIEPKVYGMFACNIKNLNISNINIDVGDLSVTANQDGIHVMGPCENITIENCKIRSHDNFIAINADDVWHGRFCTMGDIKNVRIDNITVNNYDAGQGMLLLSANHKVHNVTVTNINGKAAYLSNIHTFDFGQGNFENITFDKCHIERNGNEGFPFINIFGNFGTLNLKNISMYGVDNNKNILMLQNRIHIHNTTTTNTNIKNLNIENLDFGSIGQVTNSSYYGAICVDNDVIIENINIDKMTAINNDIRYIPLEMYKCNVKNIKMMNLDISNAYHGYLYANKSTIENITIENSRLDEKSVYKIWYDNDGSIPKIKNLNVINSGLIYVRSKDYVENINITQKIVSDTIPNNENYYYPGQIINCKNPATTGFVGWVCTTFGCNIQDLWEPSTDYSVGDIVKSGNWFLKCIKGGVSGSSISVVEGDFNDGTVFWRYMFDNTAVFSKYGQLIKD